MSQCMFKDHSKQPCCERDQAISFSLKTLNISNRPAGTYALYSKCSRAILLNHWKTYLKYYTFLIRSIIIQYSLLLFINPWLFLYKCWEYTVKKKFHFISVEICIQKYNWKLWI